MNKQKERIFKKRKGKDKQEEKLFTWTEQEARGGSKNNGKNKQIIYLKNYSMKQEMKEREEGETT